MCRWQLSQVPLLLFELLPLRGVFPLPLHGAFPLPLREAFPLPLHAASLPPLFALPPGGLKYVITPFRGCFDACPAMPLPLSPQQFVQDAFQASSRLCSPLGHQLCQEVCVPRLS